MKARAIIAGIVAGTLGGAAGAPGFTVKTGENGGFAHWGDGGGTIFYEVADPAGSIGDRELNQIETAFQTWAAPAHGNVRFVFTGRTRRPRAEKDGRNLLVWRKDWPYGTENLAVTSTWMNPETAAIGEVDIEFNARDYDWTGSGPVDLLTVALHEIGHLLGLGHSFYAGAAMHDALPPERPIKRTLSRDDLDAVAFLYPVRNCHFSVYPLDSSRRSQPEAERLPGPASPSFQRSIALAAVDADRDGVVDQVAAAWNGADDRPRFEVRDFQPDGPGRFPLVLGPVAPPELKGVRALAGVDLDGDGFVAELAAVSADGERETVRFFDLLDPEGGPAAELDLGRAPACNVVGIAALNTPGEGALAILRAERDGFLLEIVPFPEPGAKERAAPSAALRLPGFGSGSRLLGVASSPDADVRELLFLEYSPEAGAWIHIFDLERDPAGAVIDLSYDSSFPAGEESGALLYRLAVMDPDRDGWADELVILGVH